MIDIDWRNPKNEMPKEIEDNIIYSVPVAFKTKNGREYEGWFRFDFEEWIVAGKQISFGKEEVTEWQNI